MILRGLADAMREQNWFAVFVELALIVVGVFLGIQVSSWNEERIERQQESLVLGRIARDLQMGIEILHREREIFLNVRESARILSDTIEYGERLDDDSFVIHHLIQAGQHGVAPAEMEHDVTFREMLESGRLNLIKNPDLRERLITYYREVNWLIRALGNLPRANLSFIKAVGLYPAEFGEYGAKLSATQKERLLTVAREDTELPGLLRHIHAALVFHDRLFERLIPLAEELLAEIELETQ